MNLNDYSKEELIVWLNDAAKLWLAHDGLWFQSVERKHDMAHAIEHDTNAWEKFSPIEAKRIKKRLNLGERPGLEGLKLALKHRLYALLNVQEIVEESDNSIIFKMVDCRVQSARRKKNLDEFPCKSVGIVEYTTFAKAIDDRIETECIGCPPDKHPDEYFCAWRFTLKAQ